MKQKTLAAAALVATLPAMPAHAHHEYSSDGGLLSLVSSSPAIALGLGIAGFIAISLVARRRTR